MQINPGYIRLFKLGFGLIFCVHFYSCIWFYAAKITNFHRDTWVVRYGYVDSDSFDQYIISFYWCVQTLTTVGFGDICSYTSTEFILTMIWMLMGVIFYAYLVSNITNVM